MRLGQHIRIRRLPSKKAYYDRKIKMKIDDVNYKIGKVYGILDDLLNKYKTDKSLIKTLKNPFNVCE